MPAPIRSRTTSRCRSENASTRSGSSATIFSSLNVVKPPTRAFSSTAAGRRAVPGTPTTRSPTPSRKAISAVSAVRQTMRRGNSARLVPYIRGPGPPLRGARRLLERDVTEPHARECRQVRGHDQIDPVAGILQAHVDLLTAGDEPRGRRAATGRHAAKLESHDDAPVREAVDGKASPYVPEQQHRVEVLGRGAPVDPPLAPGAERLDHTVELCARLTQAVFAASPRRPALDDAGVLEMAQALGQERARDQWDSAPDLGEPPASREELAKDQRRPPLREDLTGNRDRTELPVAVHAGGTLGRSFVSGKFIFWAFGAEAQGASSWRS